MTNHFDVLIIGAGISGISAAYHLKTESPNRTFAILEGRKNIGGTWDLFKYPGIRSDSDMYTLGFSFRPWTNPKAIADGPSILQYLKDAVSDYDLEKHIKKGHKTKNASWSSENATWTVQNELEDGSIVAYTCNFLFLCTGYYNYDKGFTPDFKGMEDFNGKIIHPQHWPEDFDYTNKNIVVIGSGATAITLIPALADKAEHVTMLQRSPTYITAAPSEDRLANLFNKVLPHKLAYTMTRWKKITFGRLFYWWCKAYPEAVAKTLIKGVKKELGEDFDVAKHFTPKYNPWDQRLCMCPDSDFFNVLKTKKASVVTDHIDRFTPTGIALQSGEAVAADVIITATGLDLVLTGGVDLVIDGKKLDASKTVTYKGMMFSDVPNMAQAFGYTNASWTLKCDLTSQYVCRVLNLMEKKGYKQCTARQNDPNLELLPWVDFNSSYILRHIDDLPKQGAKLPWKLKQNYFADRKMIGKGKLEDGFMEFV